MKTEEKNKLIDTFLNRTVSANQYHENWNELMQVVEKIESLSNEQKVINWSRQNKCIFDIKLTEAKIEAVYNACIAFIEWYNKNAVEH